MRNRQTLKAALLLGLSMAAAMVLFIPIISRGFLTHYAHNYAEQMLQMEIEMSAAELHLLSGSVIIQGLKVYHPIRKKETFMKADKIALRLQYLPFLIGKPPQLTVAIDHPQMTYATNRRGQWELSKQIPLFRRGKGERRLPINVDSIVIKNGEVEYRDGKVGKATRLSDIEVDVTRVRLPTKGDPLPSKFDLSFRIDKTAKYKMKGRADFLSPKVSFDADIKLKGLSLPPFAPYYDNRRMPVRIKRGSLAMTSKAHCQNDYLKAPAVMTISGLQVEPKQKFIFGFAANRVTSGLKDKNDNLTLNAMISGNIRSPQFHVTSSLSSAFSRGLTSGLGNLAKDMPGTIGDIGKGTGEGAKSGFSKIRGLFGN